MTRISNKIFALDSFKKEYRQILLESVKSGLPDLTSPETTDTIHNIDWDNALSCASILHQSSNVSHLDASLRIAQSCLLNKKTSETQRAASAIILEGLTNKPAIELALTRQMLDIDYKSRIPFSLKLDILKRDFVNSIVDRNQKLIYLNKFQIDVYNSYKTHDYLSVSAPTSAGKSFILERIILEQISTSTLINIVYVVPTRALINQVETQLRSMFEVHEISNVFITTVPQQLEEADHHTRKVFVFTQERLNWFRIEFPNFPLHLIIVDEAHKIEDGSRGILLQHELEKIMQDFSDVKIFYSSPYTANPEVLLLTAPQNKTQLPIKTEFISVNQNLIYVNQKFGKPKEWN